MVDTNSLPASSARSGTGKDGMGFMKRQLSLSVVWIGLRAGRLPRVHLKDGGTVSEGENRRSLRTNQHTLLFCLRTCSLHSLG